MAEEQKPKNKGGRPPKPDSELHRPRQRPLKDGSLHYDPQKEQKEHKKIGRPKKTEEQRELDRQKRKEEAAKDPDYYKKPVYDMHNYYVKGGAPQSLERYCNATDEEVAQFNTNVVKWYQLGTAAKPQSDEEVKQRLDAYFDHICRTGEKPSIEKMALALGVTTRSLEYWANGERGSALRQSIIQEAYQVHAAIDAELVNNGKIPQVVYIFRSKNFFGMRDQTEIVHHADSRREIDEQALRKRIMDAVIVEDADFEDVTDDGES